MSETRKQATAIPIPQTGRDGWEGTTGVRCECGGMIEWAEAAYVPGTRACRRCLLMYSVRGMGGAERRLQPQMEDDEGIIRDADGDTDDADLYRVPSNLYPGWHVSRWHEAEQAQK